MLYDPRSEVRLLGRSSPKALGKRAVQGRQGAGVQIRSATRALFPEGDGDGGDDEQDREGTLQGAGRQGVARRARAGNPHSNHLHTESSPYPRILRPQSLCGICLLV